MAKFYKELSRCKLCRKRYVVDKKSEVYQRKGLAKLYCKQCYKTYCVQTVR